VIPLINVETLTTWVATLVAEAVVIVGAAGEAVVICGHEVSLGSLSSKKSQPKSESSSSSEPAGPEVETTVSRSQDEHI
jgi:hypothetical protein